MGSSKEQSNIFGAIEEYASRKLSEADFRSTFKELMPQTRKQFFKFERLQCYQEPGDPSYEAFLAGDLETAVRHLEERMAAQSGLFLRLCRDNVPFIRVRAVEFPMSEYLNYEFKSYRISARYGERVLVTNLSSHGIPIDFIDSTDFVMFDETAVLVHIYDSKGFLEGAWLVDRPTEVARFISFAQALIASSVPLGVFEREHGL